MPEFSTKVERAIDDRVKAPLTPGQPIDLAVDMTPTAAVVRAGEILELAIASRPSLLGVPVRDGFVTYEGPLPPYVARNTLLHGARTSLELTMARSPS
jgi:predicted acyl esterase